MSQFEKLFLLILTIYCISSLGQVFSIPMDFFGFVVLIGVGLYLVMS